MLLYNTDKYENLSVLSSRNRAHRLDRRPLCRAGRNVGCALRHRLHGGLWSKIRPLHGQTTKALLAIQLEILGRHPGRRHPLRLLVCLVRGAFAFYISNFIEDVIKILRSL